MAASAVRPDALPIANAAVLHLKGDLRGALDCLLSVEPELESADLGSVSRLSSDRAQGFRQCCLQL